MNREGQKGQNRSQPPQEARAALKLGQPWPGGRWEQNQRMACPLPDLRPDAQRGSAQGLQGSEPPASQT